MAGNNIAYVVIFVKIGHQDHGTRPWVGWLVVSWLAKDGTPARGTSAHGVILQGWMG